MFFSFLIDYGKRKADRSPKIDELQLREIAT
jgi:hypothetical protein